MDIQHNEQADMAMVGHLMQLAKPAEQDITRLKLPEVDDQDTTAETRIQKELRIQRLFLITVIHRIDRYKR